MSILTLYMGGTQDRLVPYEKTVIEKRAPTDDSIRLYEEIKTKAYKSIIDSMEVNDNLVNFKAIIFEDYLMDNLKCVYAIKLNGKVIDGETIIAKSDIAVMRLDVRRVIFDHMARHIAKDLVMSIAKDLVMSIDKG